MVTINKIKENSCELYGPDNNCVGIIDNYLSFADIRIQIKAKELEGYYVVFQGIKIPIDKDGKVNTWPDGFFDDFDNMLYILL